jgi:hypothetical protein
MSAGTGIDEKARVSQGLLARAAPFHFCLRAAPAKSGYSADTRCNRKLETLGWVRLTERPATLVHGGERDRSLHAPK